jgi:putative copper export protein
MTLRREYAEGTSTGSVWLLLFGAFVLVGAFFLITEHRAHLLGALPYLLAFAALFVFLLGHRHAARSVTHGKGVER